LQTPSGLATPSGMTSVMSTVTGGLETPDFLELRKNAARPPEPDHSRRSLYQVVEEKQTSVRGLMGSERGYDMSAVSGGSGPLPVLGDERGTKRKANGVDVSIDAADLENMSEDKLRKKYDAQSKGSAGVPGSKEDLSEVVAMEGAKRRKMEADRAARKGSSRDFKF